MRITWRSGVLSTVAATLGVGCALLSSFEGLADGVAPRDGAVADGDVIGDAMADVDAGEPMEETPGVPITSGLVYPNRMRASGDVVYLSSGGGLLSVDWLDGGPNVATLVSDAGILDFAVDETSVRHCDGEKIVERSLSDPKVVSRSQGLPPGHKCIADGLGSDKTATFFFSTNPSGGATLWRLLVASSWSDVYSADAGVPDAGAPALAKLYEGPEDLPVITQPFSSVLFWMDHRTRSILRIPKTGGTVGRINIGPGAGRDLALINGAFVWIDGNEKALKRVGSDLQSASLVVGGLPSTPTSLAATYATDRLYWTSEEDKGIYTCRATACTPVRLGPSGGDVEVLFSRTTNGKLLWINIDHGEAGGVLLERPLVQE